jgi:hypothetical protein
MTLSEESQTILTQVAHDRLRKHFQSGMDPLVSHALQLVLLLISGWISECSCSIGTTL